MKRFERTCRVCGCTQHNACLTIHGGCYWVEEDLCSECVGMRKIAFFLSRRKLVVVEVKKDELLDLTNLDSNIITVNNSLLKISADNRLIKAMKIVQDGFLRNVRVLYKKRKSYVGLIRDNFDFKSLEKIYNTEVYYYH